MDLANQGTRTWWRGEYLWLRGRVLFEEWRGEAFDHDGRLFVISASTTGRAFSVWIPAYWWRRWKLRKEIPLFGKRLPLPPARLLKRK